MPDDKSTLPLTLTALEVIYLTDSIANSDVDQGDVDNRGGVQPLARPLLLKLGSAYCELVAPSGYDATATVTLSVTEPEAWLLRGKVQTGTTGMDKSVIGVGLLRKLYGLLLAFNSEPVTEEFRVTSTEAAKDRFGEVEKRALEELERRGEHASAKPRDDANQDNRSGEDAAAQKGAEDQARPDLPGPEGQGDSPGSATPPVGESGERLR